MREYNSKIQVMLSIRPKLLSEVIRNLVEHQPDMEVTGEVLDPIGLLSATRSTKVDVVIITPQKANAEPRICSLLLIEHPLLKIITISAQCEVAFLYQSSSTKKRICDMSEQSILDAIRGSVR